jgi:hypothetical protein
MLLSECCGKLELLAFGVEQSAFFTFKNPGRVISDNGMIMRGHQNCRSTFIYF